ncbi:uncharacterized protein LOC119179872 [Rhipicephalus microplus]|uniref:uncharacterized protein LOC119179872 n=1 Tax=Rhipicephalus microplus TaxID=6941 RepID=UPI003F6A7AFB
MDSRRHHKSCCAEWCQNSSRHTGIKFFRIPADERSRAWLQYATRQDLAHLPPRQSYSSYRLCSAHFTSRDYADPGQTRLLRCAVPTVSIFGDGQTHVESPGSPRPANTTAMPAHSADEEVQQTEPSCLNPADRQHKPSRCSPRTARKMKNLEKINSRLWKALSRIGKRKVKKLSQSEALNAIRPYVRKTFFRLLETQVKINGVKRRGRRWSPEHRQFALNLYFHGPKAYRHLSRLLDMPTVRSLKQWL